MYKTQTEKRVIKKIVGWASLIGGVALLVIAGLAWWGGSFATGMVHDQLAAQKIYFPPKGSAALNPAEFPDLQKYAGQQVDNGDKAKAYAEGFIGRHLQKIAAGKTYAEVSTAAMANPADQKLQSQKATLFQGETLRGLLLGDAYAYGTIGKIAKTVAVACLVLSLPLLVLTLTRSRYLLQ